MLAQTPTQWLWPASKTALSCLWYLYRTLKSLNATVPWDCPHCLPQQHVPKTTGCFGKSKQPWCMYYLQTVSSRHCSNSDGVPQSALWRQGEGKKSFSYFPQVWDCPHCPVTAFGTANMTKLTWRALACRLVDVMWKGKESSLCVGQGKIPRISGERLTQNNCSVCINTFEPLQHRKEKIFQTVGICLAFSIGSSFASQNMLI